MIKLDEFTNEELETLKKLIDDEIRSCYKMKEITQNHRLNSMEDRNIAKLSLLRVKIENALGSYE